MKVSHQIPTWIAGKMTPVLQLTDTDLAMPMKVAAEQKKMEISREIKNAARARGQIPDYHLGIKEVLRVCQAAHQKMVKMNEEQNTAVAGMRRNGMIAYIPDSMTGKLKMRTRIPDSTSCQRDHTGSSKIG